MTVLVTGAAGFIGFHTVQALLARGETVVGLDNLNAYYSPALKRARLDKIGAHPAFTFIEADITEPTSVFAALAPHRIDRIIHLAAQAGVRYSLEAPFSYVDANVTGHLGLLEYARNNEIHHLVYASSSSVYGRNTKAPFAETDITELPASLYGATKKADELMASAYAHLYAVPLTGLRFFTVYGPWGRPDMAYWIFTEKMLRGEPIAVFNHGQMARDFTYIDDIVAGVLAALDRPPGPDRAFHQVYNLGNDKPEPLLALIEGLEREFETVAEKDFQPMQKGDVEKTWADISEARRELGYAPKTSLAEGLAQFAHWWKSLEHRF